MTHWTAVIATLLCLSVSGQSADQPPPFSQETPSHGREYLRGLPGVSLDVYVRTSDDDLTQAVLTGKVRTDIELRLREFHVPVQQRGDASLSVLAFVGPREGATYSYMTELAVYQRLRSLANGRVWRMGHRAFAPVWTREQPPFSIESSCRARA